ncbi:TIR domain-containing protein [Hymenobacter mucosus]|uniref:TIR domain-containing protein n=1 Tax=Hymenobacter mucosus TaxID=1411120 RepID=A0A239BC53_9BACT|nr:TIR domain-containing protein [Hymenobacter mucosus]
MSRCTAPTRGHRTASARAECPACGGRSYGSSYGSYSPPSYSPPSYSTGSGSSSRSSGGESSRTIRPRWSRGGSGSGGGSVILYSPAQIQELTPVRENIEKQFAIEKQLVEQHLPVPDTRDYFLCHAWNDRKEVAKDLYDKLIERRTSVWFSEKDVLLGSTLMREIDKGLAKSRTGIVLVTPAFLQTLTRMGVADKELSALLSQGKLVPVLHETTFEELYKVSPLLASRAGLNTSEESLSDIADRLAELVAP